jgi:hypothetical protein
MRPSGLIECNEKRWEVRALLGERTLIKVENVS